MVLHFHLILQVLLEEYLKLLLLTMHHSLALLNNPENPPFYKEADYHTALSASDCLKLTQNKHYDGILMDHLMPEMDGIECLHAIRTQSGGS